MALLTILEYPDPRLNRVAEPVTVFDERLRELVRGIHGLGQVADELAQSVIERDYRLCDPRKTRIGVFKYRQKRHTLNGNRWN